MEFKEIAEALVEGCKTGKSRENLSRLYAEDAVSIEPSAPEGQDPVTRGRAAIEGKHIWWEENFTVHDARVEGPFPGQDNRFAVIFWMDAEEKASGNRHEMSEVALYTVEGGLITREEFFYG